jgi:hypothetical protein
MKQNELQKRIVISILSVVLLFLSATNTTNKCISKTPILNRLDTNADKYYDESFKEALIVYAVARAINAGISMVQDVELSAVVINLPLGQVLDPINDLVERFSLVMLLSTASLGIQKILMAIGSWLGFRLLLSISLLIILISMWLPPARRWLFFSLGYKLIVLSVIIRFCLPVVGTITGEIDDLFLKAQTAEATSALQQTQNDIDAMEITTENEMIPPEAAAEPSMWLKMKGMYDGAKSQVDIERRLEQIKAKAAQVAEHIIDLIVVFILRTIIVPILSLWAFIRFAGFFTGMSVAGIEKKFKTSLHGPGG